KEVYGHAFRDQITEGVTLRVVASAEVDQLRLPNLKHGGRANPEDALLNVGDTVFDDGHQTKTPRYERDKLLAEDTVNGPAIITQHNSTTIVPPGNIATVLGHGDIRITRT
ncbi:MAG: hydantoinase/oxoprolinase family protein, partial [Pseudomonadota bacterium]